MKIVQKISRKRYHHQTVYEYERLLLPLPKEYYEEIQPWLKKDLRIVVESVTQGLLILVCESNGKIDPWPLILKFRNMVKEFHPKKT